MTFPANIGPEDLVSHAEDIAVLRESLDGIAAIAVDFLIGHSTVIAATDEAAVQDNHRLMRMVECARHQLQRKLAESKAVCDAALSLEAV